ncbi:MAG TPA: radical SAM protein, partial [Allosphingosinicella sp.]|nr:radical SAM protein [Allosphingosinicella sp.]
MPRPNARPGRGAPENRTPDRFNLPTREADGDWLDARDGVDGEAPPLRTTVTVEHPRTIIARNSSPDIGFDRSINPYRGCEHGCIYCFARPTHSYLNLSPGIDFETRIVAKVNAAERLRAELSSPRYVPRALNIGSATDAYQPIERRLGITRSVLEVLAETRHAFSVITKSSGVERDIDLLAPLARDNL